MRLSNFWIPVIDTARAAIKQPEQQAAALASQLASMLDAAAARAQSKGFSDDDIQLSLFAVVAWIDELAMSWPWSGEADWRRTPLQRTYFSTTRAGAAFFEKLDALPDEATEVREVYALVLLAGFQGRYIHRPPAELHTYRRSLFERVAAERTLTPLAINQPLFPDANLRTQPPAPYMRGLVPSLVGLLVILVPICLLLCLYVLLDYRLAQTAAEWLSPLASHG